MSDEAFAGKQWALWYCCVHMQYTQYIKCILYIQYVQGIQDIQDTQDMWDVQDIEYIQYIYQIHRALGAGFDRRLETAQYIAHSARNSFADLELP